MLHCTIDNQVAYPDTSEKIKVTYENPFVKDSGEYTYEITFPMAIMANYAIFKAANRLEVTKTLPTYEDVKMYSNNRLVMSGKGVVTAITNESVKLQVVGGASRIKYNSRFEKHFIDEMDLGSAPEFTWESSKLLFGSSNVYRYVPIDKKETLLGKKDTLTGTYEYVFVTVYDETNSMSRNLYLHSNTGNYKYFIRPAVQPSLLRIFKAVMEKEGYAVKIDELENSQFINLYVASARNTLELAKTLPHWTVYTFIEEFRKLFNATMVFNDSERRVEVMTQPELSTSDTVTYDIMDEFSTEYDEEGLGSYYTSNLEYDLEDSANRSNYDVVSLDVMKNFPPKDVASVSEINSIALTMTGKELLTTLFRFTGSEYKGLFMYYDSSGERDTRRLAGFFSPLVRDIDSDDTVKLLITPAAYDYVQRWSEDNPEDMGWVEFHGNVPDIPLISVTNDRDCPSEQMTYDDEDGEYYVSVADAMAGTEVEEEEDTDEKLKLFFLSPFDYNALTGQVMARTSVAAEGENITARYPLAYTDCRRIQGYVDTYPGGSLSLNDAGEIAAVGNFHKGERDIKNKTQIIIKFVTDDIPDPSKTYIFHNRRYLCSKIEMEVSNDGVSKVKTGYFYEMD